MRFRSSLLLLATAALAVITRFSAALADEEEALQTVVITGEKRTENLQRAPVAVTVISSDAMAAANVSDFSDLAKFAPSLTMTKGDQPGNSAAVIRGVGTFAFSVAVNPSVLVVIDDVAAGYQAQAFEDLVDIESVEVLEGPQSTLYGKSAAAGLIVIKTKAPTDTFTYFGDITVTNDGEQRPTFSVSGPLSDTVNYRFSGSYRNFDGNLRNIFTDEKINTDDTYTGSAKIEWKPTAELDAVFAAHWEKDNSVCCGQPYTRIDMGAGAPPKFFGKVPEATVFAGVPVGPTNTDIALSVSPIADSQEYGFSSHVTYKVADDLSLLSITSFDKYTLHDLTDYDGTDVDMMQYFTPCSAFGGAAPTCNNANANNTTIAVNPTVVHGDILQGGLFDVTTIAQELRLSRQGSGHFNWVAGLYVDSEDDVRIFGRGFQNYSMPLVLVPNSKADTSWRGEADYQNYALFGQSGWEFTPGTTLITGLRLNRENSQYNYVDYYRQVFFPTTNTNPAITNPPLNAPFPADYTDDVWTGKAGLQQQFTPDFMGFATISRGYKGVGYDLTSNLSPTEAGTFPVKRETSVDYELGARTEWFDHRLVLNATGFWMDYKNFQISSLAPSPPNPPNTFILTNIPAVRTRGVELASTAAVTRDLNVGLNYAYTQAIATDFPYGQCYPNETQLASAPITCSVAAPAPVNPAKFQNLSGQTLPNAPKNKITADVNWNLPLGGPLSVKVNASTVWQSEVNYGLNEDPGTAQKAYDITNLNLTFSLKNQPRFSLSFFVNNLFDTHYDANIGNVAGNFTWPAQPPGTQVEAYTHEVARDYDRFYGLRFAFTSD
jgi:iron complex outermembrane receptor protein